MESTVRRRRRKRRPALPFVCFIGIVLAVSLVLGLAFRYKPTTEHYNGKQYFGLTDDSSVALVVNNERLEEQQGMIRDGVVYLTYDQVKDSINDRFYWEESRRQMLYTLPDQVAVCQEGDGILLEGDTVYISMDLVRRYTPMVCEIFDSPTRVVMDTETASYQVADVKADQAVRYRGGVKSPILTDVEKGTTLRILEEGDNWDRVRTDSGYIGYIERKYLENRREETVTVASRNEGYTSLTGDKPMNLVWHQVTNQGQNDELSARLLAVQGVNVICPTWFYLSDEMGGVHSLASSAYVSYAHDRGLQVWGMVDNFTQEGISTLNVLANPDSRQCLIDNLLYYAAECGLDGLNIDFEELAKEMGPAFVQFIRELSLRCHENGLILSVDNHVPYDYNSFYNRPEQAVFADYVILMGYDEHLNESTGEGSVASIDFVTSAIDRMLEEVPKEKLINALPFYTRFWKEVPKTEEQLASENGSDSTEEYVPYTLNWDTLGMAKAQETLDQQGITPNWDETTKQYYAEYTLEDGTVCKVWMEEERSLEEKLKVMKDRQLAGVAAWKLGLEKDSVWGLIANYYNGE